MNNMATEVMTEIHDVFLEAIDKDNDPILLKKIKRGKVNSPPIKLSLGWIWTERQSVGKPLFTKHPASPVHLHVPISTIEFLLKLTPACS